MHELNVLIGILSDTDRQAISDFRSGDNGDRLAELVESGDWSDEVNELAAMLVSERPHERLTWLLAHWQEADTAEAINNGAKTADQAASWCWYQAEFIRLDSALASLKELWDEAGDTAVLRCLPAMSRCEA